MFRDVSACSVMFRNVPGFIDALKLHPSLSVVSTRKAHSLALHCFTVTLSADYIDLFICSIGSYFSTESAKFGAFKKRLSKKNKNL